MVYLITTTILIIILVYGLAFCQRSRKKKIEAGIQAVLKHNQFTIMAMSFQAHISRIQAANRPKDEKYKAIADAMEAFKQEVERLKNEKIN